MTERLADHTTLRLGGPAARLVAVATEEELVEAVRTADEAGEPWDPFVERCVGEGLAGVECLSGIPGSTGATPIQNVGAYGQDVSETIVRVRVYDRTSGAIEELPNEACEFTY